MEKTRAPDLPAGGPQRWKFRKYSVWERPTPFGRRFEVRSPDGSLVLFCKSRRSDPRLVFFTDESESAQIFRFEPKPLRHYQRAFEVVDAFTDRVFGQLRKKVYGPLKKEEWFILGPEGETLGLVSETAPRPNIVTRFLPVTQFWKRPWALTWGQTIAGTIQPRRSLMGERVDVDLGLDMKDEIDRRLVLGVVVAMRRDHHAGGNHKKPAKDLEDGVQPSRPAS